MTVEIVGESVFVMHEGVVIAAPNATAAKATSVVGTKEDYINTAKHVLWGDADNFPAQMKEDLRADTVLKPGIRLKAEIMNAGGVTYGKPVIENGNLKWQYIIDPVIRKFFRDNHISLQFYSIFYDLVMWQWHAPQFVLSKDKKKIVRFTSEFTKTAHCRMGRLNSNGYPDKIYLNPDFGTNDYKEDKTKSIPCAPQFNTVEWMRDTLNGGDACVMPIILSDGFNQYYPEPDINTARESKWVQIGKDVAVFNKSLLSNKLTILYHIETHENYWPATFGEKKWKDANATERVALIKTWAEAIAKALKGTENAGGVFQSPLMSVPNAPDKSFPLIKITKVDKEIDFKEGAYIPMSQEASQHKIFSLGLHSDITGITPGSSGMGSGSGSSARVAFNQRVLLAKGVQDIAIRPLYVIQEYNGWDPEIEFAFESSLITTLDKGAEAETATNKNTDTTNA